YGPRLLWRHGRSLFFVPQVERWGARARTFPVAPQSVVLGIQGLLLVLLRGLRCGGLRLPLRASELARLVVPRLPLPFPLDFRLRRILPPLHLLRVEAIDQALFQGRGPRGAAPQPLQNAPEIGSGEGNYTTH